MTYRLTVFFTGVIVYLLCVADGHAASINWPLDQPSSGSPWTIVSGGIAWDASGWGAATGGGGVAADGGHTNLLFRSPQFKLDGSGDLTVQLRGGRGKGSSSGAASAPTNESQIPLGVGSTSGGIQAFSLRRVSTGAYLLFGEKSVAQNSLQTVSLTQAQLAPYANDGNFYTIDFYDTRNGGWGHTEITNVTVPGVVPEPSTFALSAIGLLGLLGWGRRRRIRI